MRESVPAMQDHYSLERSLVADNSGINILDKGREYGTLGSSHRHRS